MDRNLLFVPIPGGEISSSLQEAAENSNLK
jgi:hypothetical protein